jgi:hypothetical protein
MATGAHELRVEPDSRSATITLARRSKLRSRPRNKNRNPSGENAQRQKLPHQRRKHQDKLCAITPAVGPSKKGAGLCKEPTRATKQALKGATEFLAGAERIEAGQFGFIATDVSY